MRDRHVEYGQGLVLAGDLSAHRVSTAAPIALLGLYMATLDRRSRRRVPCHAALGGSPDGARRFGWGRDDGASEDLAGETDTIFWEGNSAGEA